MHHFQAQIVLLIILLVAILDFLIGAFIGPLDSDEFTRGYVGFNGTYFFFVRKNLVYLIMATIPYGC